MISSTSRRDFRSPKAGAARSNRAGRTTNSQHNQQVARDRAVPLGSPDLAAVPALTGSETGSPPRQASGYRPICDTWLLARPKVAYYGAYPMGFLERARALLGVGLEDPVLHVCGGRVREYPGRGFGPSDRTLDADPDLTPDFLQDAREPYPELEGGWPAILIDPPYTEEDAEHYATGKALLPNTKTLLQHALDAVRVGGKVGILHYLVPRPPANARLVAIIGVVMGFGNRIRAYTVFERTY